MREMSRIFRRGPVWWIVYCHHGKEYRECHVREGAGMPGGSDLAETSAKLAAWVRLDKPRTSNWLIG
jgi:hypothetical protein